MVGSPRSPPMAGSTNRLARLFPAWPSLSLDLEFPFFSSLAASISPFHAPSRLRLDRASHRPPSLVVSHNLKAFEGSQSGQHSHLRREEPLEVSTALPH